MEAAELRTKVMEYVNQADERMLRVVKTVFDNFENPNEYELPETAEKLIWQAMEESEKGFVTPHNEVMDKFKNKKKEK